MDHLQRTFDYVAEHPVESVGIAVAAVVAVVGAVAFAPAVLTAAGATFGTVKLIEVAIGILIGVSIFNDKGK